MTKEEMVRWINQASYEDLLRRWRFARSGDPNFIGEVGEHYKAVMSQKRAQVGSTEAARISKRVGWGRLA